MAVRGEFVAISGQDVANLGLETFSRLPPTVLHFQLLGRGASLNAFLQRPSGDFKRLRERAADENPDEALLKYDWSFHTIPAHGMILYPAVHDMTPAHYKFLQELKIPQGEKEEQVVQRRKSYLSREGIFLEMMTFLRTCKHRQILKLSPIFFKLRSITNFSPSLPSCRPLMIFNAPQSTGE